MLFSLGAVSVSALSDIVKVKLVFPQVLCQYLLSLPGDIQGKPLPRKPKNFSKEAQKVAVRLLQENVIRHYEILSLDLLGNGLLALVEMGCMYKDRR